MPVPSTITDLSTTAALNSPAGSDAIANTLDDYLRATQAILKGQFSTGSAISVSTPTITVPVTGSYFVVTGATTVSVTGFTSNFDGRIATFKFSDANITLVNSGSLILPNAANITTAAGDVAVFVNEGSGSTWRCVSYSTQGGSMPVGTRMTFAQASAPVGWSQVTDDSATNRMLRVVNTAGAGTGGSNSPILMNVVPSHTHTFTTGNNNVDHYHGVSFVSGGMNSNATHSHTVTGGFSNNFLQYSAGGGGNLSAPAGSLVLGSSATAATANIDHTHNIVGNTGGTSATHVHSGTSDANASASNWTPRYLDLIVCQKN